MKQNSLAGSLHYRKMIRSTDPRISIQIPVSIYTDLKKMAAYNARKFSDEIVARLAETLQQWDSVIFQTQPLALKLDKGEANKK